MSSVPTFEVALQVVLAHAGALPLPRAVEDVALLDARGRVLAEAVMAERDQPPFDRATRDGYAVRAAGVGEGRLLRVVGSVRAGESWQGAPLAAGESVEIMTGAPMPAGANAVLMVEHATLAEIELRVEAGRRLRVGENVVARGAEALAGAPLLPVGRLIEAAEIAVAASCGCRRLPIFARPRVSILATGDELVELDVAPEPAQIRNSNSYALAALVEIAGGTPGRLPIARDSLDDLRRSIAAGREADLLLLSGGVSMGKFDLVEQVLAELDAEFFFTGAMIQPGKPIVFGRLPQAANPSDWTYFFGLPGNPVSTQVCFHLFVAPMLRALAGRAEIAPRFIEAALAEDVRSGPQVTRFLPAELMSSWDGVSVRIVGWQGSGDVAANARGNSYAVLPVRAKDFAKGETVRVLLR